jgi:DNA-binding response OmpR family regulator
MKTQPYRALVVDDEVVARRMLAMALKQEGFVCDTACDGLHAMNLMGERKYDLIVTDLKMPNKHGHSLAVDILVDCDRPVLIIHTSMDDPRLTKDLMARGVDDILYKPTNYATFATRAMFFVEKRCANQNSNTQCESNPKVAADQRPSMSEGQLNMSPRECSSAEQRAISGEPLPLPEAARKVYQLAMQDDIDTCSLAQAIEQDTGLAADLRWFGNCHHHNRSGKKLSDMPQIVTLLGHKRIAEIAQAACTRVVAINHQLPWVDVELVHKRCLVSGIVLDSLVIQGQHQSLSRGLLLCALLHPLENFARPTNDFTIHEQIVGEYHPKRESLINPTHVLVFQQDSRAWTEVQDHCENSDAVATLLSQLNSPFADVEMLPEPDRSRAGLVKLSNLLSQIAVNTLDPCDTDDTPPASLLQRLRIGTMADLLLSTSQFLSSLPNCVSSLREST